MEQSSVTPIDNSCRFIYLAYGGRQFRKQAIVSISSLLDKGPLPGTIVVFTDRPQDFHGIPVETVHLQKEQIRKWRGPYGYTHRLKIELVLDVLKKTGKPIIFVDSDTFWTRNPADIFRFIQDGFPVMYEREQPASDIPEYLSVMRKTEALATAGIAVVPPEKSWVYNSGIIGLPSSMDHEVLVQTMAFCDLVSREAPFRMEWIEQFAFSYIFTSLGFEIKTCKEDLHHYWRDNMEFSRQIRSYSKEMLLELGRDEARINQLLELGRSRRRSFQNQVIARTKRLGRSFRKRRRELLVFLERLKVKLFGNRVP